MYFLSSARSCDIRTLDSLLNIITSTIFLQALNVGQNGTKFRQTANNQH